MTLLYGQGKLADPLLHHPAHHVEFTPGVVREFLCQTRGVALGATGMTVRHQTWRRFNLFAAGPLGLTALLLLFVELFVKSDANPAVTIGAGCVFGLLCLSGAAVGLLERFGILVFSYTQSDRQRRNYRLKQIIAATESGIWGQMFSARYYENYEVQNEGERESRR